MKVLFDNKMDAANIYNISAIPITIFINKDGYIVKDDSGAIAKEELKSQIKLLLESKWLSYRYIYESFKEEKQNINKWFLKK